MKPFGILLNRVWISCFIAINCCSQTNSPEKFPPADVFVGSTPCDDLIKLLLGIEADATCEFIKWELSLYKNQNDSAAFILSALYGESQPNTNGFKNGGKKIDVSGNYTISQGMKGNPHVNVYHLNGKKVQSAFLVAEMDHNILHFIDDEKKFIVGNGGWGYALNRRKK